jgi:hypothetical protein
MFNSITLATAAIAASASIAFADTTNNLSNFVMEHYNSGVQAELETVTATSDGVVEIYIFHKAELGALIGSEQFQAGANLDVDINFIRTFTDAIAVFKVGRKTVNTQKLDFN